MRRLKSSALLITFLLSLATAWSEPTPPMWDEIAPPDMVDAQTGPVREVSTADAITGSFIPFAGPGLLLKLKDRDSDQRRNYWAQRHIQFDKEVDNCNESTGDKVACYMQIRQLETQKTADRQSHEDRVNQIRVNAWR